MSFLSERQSCCLQLLGQVKGWFLVWWAVPEDSELGGDCAGWAARLPGLWGSLGGVRASAYHEETEEKRKVLRVCICLLPVLSSSAFWCWADSFIWAFFSPPFLSLPLPSPSSVFMPSISLSSDQARSALGSGRARRRWFYEGDPAVLEFSSLNGKDRFEGSQSGKDCRCELRVLWRAWRSSTLTHRPRSCPLGTWDANSAHSRRQGSPKKVAWDNGASETLHDLN